jgi:hypothetical protein
MERGLSWPLKPPLYSVERGLGVRASNQGKLLVWILAFLENYEENEQ